MAYLTKNYEIDELHPEEMETVQNALELAEGSRNSETPSHQVVHASWPEEDGRAACSPYGRHDSRSLPLQLREAGQLCGLRGRLIGVLTYKKMKRAVLVLAEHFKKMPEKNVGVLLPASTGAFIVILALQFAKKVPVMLNS